jgi:long-chain acyl-CoA synthetase
MDAQNNRVSCTAQAMKPRDPLLSAWEKTLARKADAPAIFATSGEALRTFAEVEQRARDWSQGLDLFHKGEVLAVQIGNHQDWPSILLACLRRRLVVLPLEESMSERQRDAALELCGAGAIISGNADILPVVSRILRRAPRRATGRRARHAGNARSPEWGEHSPALLKLTSGTTAAPRAIRFRSEQLLADSNQICDTMGIAESDLNFGAIPVSHSYGFSNLLTPLIARGTPIVLSRDRTPRAMLADLARTGATVFPGTPAFYRAFCQMENVPRLPKLRLCLSAGAPLPLAIAKNFCDKFGLAIHSFYGASECGGICYDREAKMDEEGFVGLPMKGVSIEMLDPGPGPSRIRVRSAAVGDGYFPEADEAQLGEGRFVPGDLLKATPNGLRIVGRTSDMINVAGKKVNPAEVEVHLLRFSGVREAVVFGRPAAGGLRQEEVAACVVASPGVTEGNLLESCRSALSSWQVPRRIFMVKAIPMNERGKISRRDLALRFPAAG